MCGRGCTLEGGNPGVSLTLHNVWGRMYTGGGKSLGVPTSAAVLNQWTVPLEWNGGMEYWNDPYSPCYFFPEAVLGVCNVSEGLANLC